MLRQGLPLEAALARATAGLDKPADRALTHAIAGAVLRHAVDLDRLIDSVMQKPLPEDAKARQVIRIALAQMLVLNTPPHAAIATSLPLLASGPRRLAHGVIGTLSRQHAALPDKPSLPEAVRLRWDRNWSTKIVAAASDAWSSQPPLDLTLKQAADTQAWADRLGGTSLMPGHIRLPSQSVPALPGFEEGDWWVQDLAASLPARLLGPGKGAVLDLCAAPGGKTMQLTSVGWAVTAVDNAPGRLTRLDENLARTGLRAETIIADAMKWAPPRKYDAILLDAPCSATGIFRRHPDVLYRVTPKYIAEMAELQAALLRRALDWLKPGGSFVYAVCSLEPEEGERQIEQMLSERPGLAIDPIRAEELPDGLAPTPAGFVRTLPGDLAAAGGVDGFFIARMKLFDDRGSASA